MADSEDRFDGYARIIMGKPHNNVGNGVIGFFDSPEQSEPAYDPPHDGPCLVCGNALQPPLKTISLMWEDRSDKRSYFYRAHKDCYERNPQAADEVALTLMSGRTQ